MLLKLGHDLYWNRSYLHSWVLLTYHSIHNVQYLVAETCLADCSCACGDHEWPEYWRGNQAYCTDCCFVKPFLLTNHGDCAARGMLEDDAECSLKTDEHNEVTALFQLHHHLIFVADLLNLVTLHAVHVLYVIGESFKVYFFAIVKSGVH